MLGGRQDINLYLFIFQSSRNHNDRLAVVYITKGYSDFTGPRLSFTLWTIIGQDYAGTTSRQNRTLRWHFDTVRSSLFQLRIDTNYCNIELNKALAIYLEVGWNLDVTVLQRNSQSPRTSQPKILWSQIKQGSISDSVCTVAPSPTTSCQREASISHHIWRRCCSLTLL